MGTADESGLAPCRDFSGGPDVWLFCPQPLGLAAPALCCLSAHQPCLVPLQGAWLLGHPAPSVHHSPTGGRSVLNPDAPQTLPHSWHWEVCVLVLILQMQKLRLRMTK